SSTSYAQILLEFAAAPHRVNIGVAMARPGSLSRRIERLLNDNSFRQSFDGGRRAFTAVVLVPLALFASITLVRVQAAADTHSLWLDPIATAHADMAMLQLPAAPHLEARQAASAIETIQLGDQTLTESPVTPAVPAIFPETNAPTAAPVLAM